MLVRMTAVMNAVMDASSRLNKAKQLYSKSIMCITPKRGVSNTLNNALSVSELSINAASVGDQE